MVTFRMRLHRFLLKASGAGPNRPARIFRGFAGLLLVVATVTSQTLGAQAQQPTDNGLVELPGHSVGHLPRSTPVASAASAADEPVTITTILNMRDKAGFDAFLENLNNLAPPSRRYLAPSEVAERFGPTQASYDAVLAY